MHELQTTIQEITIEPIKELPRILNRTVSVEENYSNEGGKAADVRQAYQAVQATEGWETLGHGALANLIVKKLQQTPSYRYSDKDGLVTAMSAIYNSAERESKIIRDAAQEAAIKSRLSLIPDSLRLTLRKLINKEKANKVIDIPEINKDWELKAEWLSLPPFRTQKREALTLFKILTKDTKLMSFIESGKSGGTSRSQEIAQQLESQGYRVNYNLYNDVITQIMRNYGRSK